MLEKLIRHLGLVRLSAGIVLGFILAGCAGSIVGVPPGALRAQADAGSDATAPQIAARAK